MKFIKIMLYSILFTIIIFTIIGLVFINQKKFGKLPKGERLALIKKSPNYKNGKFQNLSETPTLTSNKSIPVALYEFIFNQVKDLEPNIPIPTIKSDLKKLDNDDVLVWLGHSAYYIKIDGKSFLIDPTLVSASPVPFTGKAFNGSSVFTPDDIPYIDYLIITHDHWDHLDYETIIQIQNRVGKVITGLGVGEHFEYWDYPKEKILELDWQEYEYLTPMFKITALPARHGSGRGLIQQKSLWSSFMLETPSKTIYIGGDSGYDTFYKEIGKQFPNIDIAILENGQYDEDWRYIHILPEELPKAIKDLNPKKVLTFHNSKYALGKHSWYEPLDKIYENAQKENFNLLTPMIGEIVALKNDNQKFQKWWREKQ